MTEADGGNLASPRRGNARLVVAEKWALYRINTDDKLTPSSDVVEFSIPPLCALLRRSWNQVIHSFTQKKPIPLSSTRPSGDALRASVLSVLQANAIKLQVESMENNADELSILPSNYDFATSAVNHISHSRSRAFLLMDYSAIVQTYTVWRKRFPKKVGVRMVYSARHNCNPQLIQLLHRLGIGLKVATKYDLTAVVTSTDHGAVIFDDPHVLVKPNSYYRNLVLDVEKSACMIPIAVDSSEEIERIHGQLYGICQRREQNMPKLQFIFKLNCIDIQDWKTSLIQLHNKSLEFSYEVVGVALELGKKLKSTDGPDNDNILLDALSDMIENWAQRLPGTTLPQVQLTNPINVSEIESNVIDWIENNYKFCNGIIIDVSRVLMANAAALCTRIIGVKNNDEHNQHIYIDDGFYGSLSDYPSEGTPLPLKGRSLDKSESVTSKHLLENEQKDLVNTTVWGPTCDGLDKVCSNITLPRLSRDDWLVFLDLGFCNEGTHFNGFSPPDIACCILGG